jgi:hypothetical protein
MANARETLIQSVFPLLYEIKPRASPRSSYGIKHDLEYGLFPRPDKFYFSNDETIAALVALGVPHVKGDPNYGFKIKERFPIWWIRNAPPTRKPAGERKAHWEAYLYARKAMNDIVADLIKEDMSTDSLYQKLVKVIGHEC